MLENIKCHADENPFLIYFISSSNLDAGSGVEFSPALVFHVDVIGTNDARLVRVFQSAPIIFT